MKIKKNKKKFFEERSTTLGSRLVQSEKCLPLVRETIYDEKRGGSEMDVLGGKGGE